MILKFSICDNEMMSASGCTLELILFRRNASLIWLRKRYYRPLPQLRKINHLRERHLIEMSWPRKNRFRRSCSSRLRRARPMTRTWWRSWPRCLQFQMIIWLAFDAQEIRRLHILTPTECHSLVPFISLLPTFLLALLISDIKQTFFVQYRNGAYLLWNNQERNEN